jgi:hypothetical protein
VCVCVCVCVLSPQFESVCLLPVSSHGLSSVRACVLISPSKECQSYWIIAHANDLV